ncbi:hypothetical protein DMC14_001580 [Metamycoplasma phocicerebrale]|uniref:Uncharacterized protein n=1 Tax=Metamycoplasma phocicerebrale TaxID=142649 RepID=A0A3Q9VA73_9BACT|nr:hypothetical protein [Metamycoplasma phocicerebrale]AZZ65476.1 hypothetical protein DMC14_001580 [Metamycoplasma phocicerebrale]
MENKKIGIIQIVVSVSAIMLTIFFITSLCLNLSYQSELFIKYNLKKYEDLIKALNSSEAAKFKQLSNAFLGSLITFLCIFLVSMAINIIISYYSWKNEDKKIFWFSLGGALFLKTLSLVAGSILVYREIKKCKLDQKNKNE